MRKNVTVATAHNRGIITRIRRMMYPVTAFYLSRALQTERETGPAFAGPVSTLVAL